MSDEVKTLVIQFVIASFFMPVVLSIVIIWFIQAYQRKKLQNEVEKRDALLREQRLIIEKQQAIELERNRIASEMHDDLGSGLTTIRYLSDKALSQVSNKEEAAYINRISEHSNNLVRNMSEIIWAMNSRFDNAESLVGYLRRYAAEYLAERNMPFQFAIPEVEMESINMGGETRRNVFLVFKELLHNSIKYSKATKVQISVESRNGQFSIQIDELGGIGFDPLRDGESGNGLYNIKRRMESIKGTIDFSKTQAGMNITISVPVS